MRTTPVRRIRSAGGFVVGGALVVFAAGMTLAIFLRMWTLIMGTGENTVQDDYITMTGPLSQMLSGHYQWAHFFRDTFAAGSHCLVVLYLITLANIALFRWNMYIELGLGLLSGAGVVALLVTAMGRRGSLPARALLTMALTALVFSPSQLNDYNFGISAVLNELPHLGLAVSVFAAVRIRSTRVAVGFACASIIASAWCGAPGLAVLPATLTAFVLSGRLNRPALGALGGGSVIAAAPYLVYGILWPTWTEQYSRLQFPKPNHQYFPSLNHIATGIGLPLSGGPGQTATTIGLLGLALTGFGIVGYRRVREPGERWTRTALPLGLLAYGLAGVWLESVSRSEFPSWYAAHAMPFWLGLVALAYEIGLRSSTRMAWRLWAGITLTFICASYLPSNLSLDPAKRDLYLQHHAPVSASCLRAYMVAPTACERSISSWVPPGTSWAYFLSLAKILEAHGLSVFSPHEEWTLQGDFALPSVSVRVPTTGSVFWADDTGGALPYTEVQHLNLMLATANVLRWRMHLPAAVEHASLGTCISSQLPGEVAVVRVEDRVAWQGAVPAHGCTRLVIDLSRFRGRTIAVTFEGGHPKPGVFLEYRYPVVEVALSSERLRPHSLVDAVPAPPHTSRADLALPFRRAAGWMIAGASSRGETVSTRYGLAYISRTSGLGQCLSDYSTLRLQSAFPQGVWPRAARIVLGTTGPFPHSYEVWIPYASDSRLHAYDVDLKTLQLPVGTRLAGIEVWPAANERPTVTMRFAGLRLFRRMGPSSCR